MFYALWRVNSTFTVSLKWNRTSPFIFQLSDENKWVPWLILSLPIVWCFRTWPEAIFRSCVRNQVVIHVGKIEKSWIIRHCHTKNDGTCNMADKWQYNKSPISSTSQQLFKTAGWQSHYKTGRHSLPMLLELQLTLSVAAKTHNKAPFGCR